jgi:hypothetical protein
MKTLAKTLFASALAVVFLAATAMTTTAAARTSILLSTPANAPVTFNRILVSGNVKLVIVQKNNERVEVEGDYTSPKTKITRMGRTLIIKSNEFEPVQITVSVKDLQRIDASDNVTVETMGKFDLKYLQIFLKGDAKANVKANAESMYTFIKGNADLKLSGTTLNHTLVKDSISRVNMDNLAAVKTTRTSIGEALALSQSAK